MEQLIFNSLIIASVLLLIFISRKIILKFCGCVKRWFNSKTVNLKDLNFSELRDECLKYKEDDPNYLFEDLHGPTLQEPKGITWCRPPKISNHPQFHKDGYSRFDAIQGLTDNCWFIVATANLTLHQHLLERVVPADNCNFDEVAYTGIFHFRFWQYGTWYDVVIDDTLPTIENDDGKIMLLYMTSADKNEFWSALLEKAYAKLYGGYSIHTTGVTAEAMQDFTGGMTEIITDEEKIKFDLLLDNFKMETMLVATKVTTDITHAYSITNVIKLEDVNVNEEHVELIRLRNPWGREKNWPNRSQRDSMPESDKLSKDFLRQYNIKVKKNAGEFWLTFDQFKKHFSCIQMCKVFPNNGDDKWNTLSMEGKWTQDMLQPQFHIKLSNPGNDDKCDVFIGLIQKDRRINRKPNMGIGFKVYSGIEELKEEYKSEYIELREVSKKCELGVPGQYTIIPECDNSNLPCDFLLRVFTKSNCDQLRVSTS